MNCQMAAWVVTAEPEAAREHLAQVRAFIHTIEAQLSRFRQESELSRLNARAGQTVQVSPLLWDVLVQALDAACQTDGLYDPTILDALEAAGYDRSFDEGWRSKNRHFAPALPAPLALPDRPEAAWRQIWLDPETRRVTLPPGVRIDLAGIAKGWVADQAADRLAVLGPCLVDAGGDIATRGQPPGEAGWAIGVADPHNPDTDLAVLLVKDQGVATSGIDYRRWRKNGAPQHHAIDPRTGRPAQTDLLAVTVIAPTATEADLHALVALLLGAEKGRQYLLRQRGVEGLLVCNEGRHVVTPAFQKFVFSDFKALNCI